MYDLIAITSDRRWSLYHLGVPTVVLAVVLLPIDRSMKMTFNFEVQESRK